jgi:hypothetical protein
MVDTLVTTALAHAIDECVMRNRPEAAPDIG